MKIALYTDSALLDRVDTDTRYVMDALVQSFDVSVYTAPDPALCREADVVFCRFPLPVNRSFLEGLAAHNEKLIINDPLAQLRHRTKRNLLHFPELTVPTDISDSLVALRRFAREHGSVVLKPLDQHKGYGVTKVDADGMSDERLDTIVSDFIKKHGTPMIQEFIEGVETIGDKRINVFGYEPISAVLTVPGPGSFICHESAGGEAYAADITAEDRTILRRVVPFLKENRVWWAGVDVIGPYLGEVNISTPTMIQRADRAHGTQHGVETIIRKLTDYRQEQGL